MLLAILVLFARNPAHAGAWLLPAGSGQFIAGVGYSEGSRRFDQSGQSVVAPAFRKAEASGFLEYGETDWLSLILAPTLAHEHDGPATNTVTGSDSSAFGARLALYQAQGRVIALQALIQPPTANETVAEQLANGGARDGAIDVRLMFGQSFSLCGWSAFIDIDPGVRLRANPFPDEKRLDATLGVRPRPRLLVLIQDFSSFASSSGALIAATSYSKLQGSVVYDLSPIWSVQVGGFRTFAGRDIVRETGPMGALWYSF